MSDTDRPSWDAALAQEIIGAVVLVGITRHEAEGPHLDQFWGEIVSADERAGITLDLKGSRAGKIYRLPPHLQAFERAAPGSYRLRDSDDAVVDPDYISTWEITPPAG